MTRKCIVQAKEARLLRLNGIDLYVEQANMDSHGPPPLFMVHGWTADHFRNYPVFQHLASNGYPVVCFDLRGHGWSSKGLTGAYSLLNCVDDLEAVISHFKEQSGIRDHALYGHSMGGTIALMHACLHPEGLSRMFLLAPWMKKAAKGEFLKVFEMMLSSYEKRFERELSRKKKAQEKLGLEFFPHWEDPSLLPEKEAAIELGRDMLETSLDLDTITEIKVPVHLYIGEKDRLDLKRGVEILSSLLPLSTVDVLPCGHSYAIECRDTLPGNILSRLREGKP